MSHIETLGLKRRLDYLEQGTALVLFCWLCVRLWPDDFQAEQLYPLLILLSEGLVVVLLLFRKHSATISMNMRDWALAGGGTFLALLISKGGPPLSLPLGAVLCLLGVCVQLAAKLSLWRSFGLVAANRGIRIKGPYRLIRHPMYLGYFLSQLGFLFLAPSLWNAAIYLAVWSLQIARIFAEERVLRNDEAYRLFMTRVKYRLLPGLF